MNDLLRKNKINIQVPPPNDNVTMSMGSKVLVDAVFSDLGLNEFLDGLKRDQGEKVSKVTTALVAASTEMSGLSVNRLDRTLEDDIVREEYGLGDGASRSVYRDVERLGKNSDKIVRFLGEKLKTKYGVGMNTVFVDWTSLYFEAPPNKFIKVGYSRDHRPDRPQVTVGLSVDKASGMPIGLTIMPGNVVDVTHFKETFRQLRPLLPDDAMIVFDNGAYSKENSALLDKEGMGFVTRLQMNKSDDAFVKAHEKEFAGLDPKLGEGMSFLEIEGSLGRKRFIIRNEVLKNEMLQAHRKKAERDHDEMMRMKSSVGKAENSDREPGKETGKEPGTGPLTITFGEGDGPDKKTARKRGKRSRRKPRKKHRSSNCFVDTRLSYLFPLDSLTREEAIEKAVASLTTGREGLFVLLTNRPLTASGTLEIYRSRNDIETAFRDLKHGIDWRPARCTSENAVRGRVLISFLALFCLSVVRFLHPELARKTAISLVEELTSFSLTVERGLDGLKRRIWSNFSPIIRAIVGRKTSLPVPAAPGQAVLEAFPG